VGRSAPATISNCPHDENPRFPPQHLTIALAELPTKTMNLTSVEKQHPTYDFELTRDIKDALSIAPSRAAEGGGGSVCSRSQQPHTQPSVKTFNPRTRASVGGSDAFSVAASTSMSQLVNRNGKFPVMIVYVDYLFCLRIITHYKFLLRSKDQHFIGWQQQQKPNGHCKRFGKGDQQFDREVYHSEERRKTRRGT